MDGLGPIQLRIWRAFVAHPDRLFRTSEFADDLTTHLGGNPGRQPHGRNVVSEASAVERGTLPAACARLRSSR